MVDMTQPLFKVTFKTNNPKIGSYCVFISHDLGVESFVHGFWVDQDYEYGKTVGLGGWFILPHMIVSVEYIPREGS